MPADKIYRSTAQRAHRALGAYLIHQAWVQKVDCVVVTRTHLTRFLDLSTMQTKRLNWLKDGLVRAFPHSSALFKTKGGAWSALYLSRLPFPKGFPWTSMTTKKRIARLVKAGLRASEVSVPKETTVLERLAKLAHGLTDFRG